MKLRGKVWKFGDNVDTDVIIPARFLNVSEEQVLGEHCFEDTRPGFSRGVEPGDVLVAGSNFGCGSSREHAPLAIKAAGIGAVIARGFARIFYRNALNIGLPILESGEAVDALREGDEVLVDLKAGKISDVKSGTSFFTPPIPAFIRDMIDAGGLVNFIIKRGVQ
jgi:3-isopropylmalate dehydratase small subunit